MKVETPIVKRLGPIPFWRGHERCLDALEAIYRRAGEQARKVLLLHPEKPPCPRAAADGDAGAL